MGLILINLFYKASSYAAGVIGLVARCDALFKSASHLQNPCVRGVKNSLIRLRLVQGK